MADSIVGDMVGLEGIMMTSHRSSVSSISRLISSLARWARRYAVAGARLADSNRVRVLQS